MNEYTVLYLNGIEWSVMANDWKDAILEARINAGKKEFSPKIKLVMDEDGTIINNIDEQSLTFSYRESNFKICQTLEKE